MVNIIKMEIITSPETEPQELSRRVILHESWVLKESTFGWNKKQLFITQTALLFYDNFERDSELSVNSITEVTYNENLHKDFVVTITTDKKSVCLAVNTSQIGKKLEMFIKQVRAETVVTLSDPLEEEGRYTLTFPSISTAAFKFDAKIASEVACDVISTFLEKHQDPRIKLYLVDIKDSETLGFFRVRAQSIMARDERFKIKVGNLTCLKEEGFPSWYIVNASNAKFSEGGSGTNEAIHKACMGNFAPSLKQLTLQHHKAPADVAIEYPVDIPEGCPLRDIQNVHTVIHVVGPNMCPKRPNCLFDDYVHGRELLKKCYENVLNCFYTKTGLTAVQ